jgi:anaerobic selenocysteine-containing dehydrogenase
LLGVTSAATAIGTLGASAIFSIPDEVFERAMAGPHIETWKNSICTLCAGGCGIRVRRIDDIPVRVLGNPLYPINRGAVCPMAEAGIEMLFHPDRIRQPLKRAGNRGDDKWEEISWEEALKIFTDRLQKLREQANPEKLAIVSRDNNEIITKLIRHFMRNYGSPNYICYADAQFSSIPPFLTQGLKRFPVYDLNNTNFVLNFGADLLDNGLSPVRFNKIYANLHNRKDREKAHTVHISSHMSRTAANSSEWIPIKPGTMAALALSIANVMIRYGSYNKDFINKLTFGFSNWRDAEGKGHEGFKTMVSGDYYPEKVAEITGVPAKKIVEIARSFAATEPAIAIAGEQATFTTNGFYTNWAIYCLNALKGNIGKPGGVLFSKDMIAPPFPKLQPDKIAEKGNLKPKYKAEHWAEPALKKDSINNLLPLLLEDQPYEIDTLILYRSNPLYESTDQIKCINALQKVPFLVSCASFMDESTAYADLVLPEPVFLEKWDVSFNNPSVEFSHFGIQNPVIQPLYDNLHFGDVLLQVSKRLGENITKALPWKDYKKFIEDYALKIFNSGEGTVISESVELSWIEFLKKRGWHAFEYATFEEFWDLVLEKGGWWDPAHLGTSDKNIFNTKSGKFEFYSQTFSSEVKKLSQTFAGTKENIDNLNQRWKIDARGDSIYLPHYEAPRFDKDSINFPYHLLTFQLLTNMNGQGANLALLQELSGLHSREYWNSWVEINPETAENLGIHEDDHVKITSPHGQLSVKVKIVPTVMPEVMIMPFGFGHKPFGRFKKRIGVNPHKIFISDSDLIVGIPSLISTKVSIEKAKSSEIT